MAKKGIHEPRPMRVVCIGAGISGIAAAYKAQRQLVNTELIIYERNHDVGGTWLENKYPGCACDIPAHSYTFSWEGNPKWSRFYVEAPEILQYLKDCRHRASEQMTVAGYPGTGELQSKLSSPTRKLTRERLQNNEEICSKLIPDFEFGCRRVSPGNGYLESLIKPNTKAIFDEINVEAPGFPNYCIDGGPNAPISNVSLMMGLELAVDYAFSCVRKMQSEGIASLEVDEDVANEFMEQRDKIMKDLVWTGSCASWYKNSKNDNSVTGPWCGSICHYKEALENLRWKDYKIKYLRKNRFAYFGNRKTVPELRGEIMATKYLNEIGMK
ncbi:hypothetical protein NXS19_008190 [Fusarium pseudograminearum]|nr:hypothetical protein NXS19_008190 [Fusarium pseudograminearum]